MVIKGFTVYNAADLGSKCTDICNFDTCFLFTSLRIEPVHVRWVNWLGTCTTCCDWIWQCIMISVVVINRLIGDLTILNSNFDDQSQFLETIFFPTILHMIKMHTLCFFYLCLIQKYTFCVSIIISTLFLQVFSWNFMKNAQHMMCGAHGEGSMYTKKTPDHRSLWWNDDQSSNLYRFPKNQIIVWCSTQHGVTS